jgi:hypothetical protein
MRLAVFVVHIGKMKNAYEVLVTKPERKIPLGRFRCEEEKIILKWMLKKYGLRMWAGVMWFIIGSDGGLL